MGRLQHIYTVDVLRLRRFFSGCAFLGSAGGGLRIVPINGPEEA